jgi:acyl-CoA reductase-like NAD-dependent aldehyde dehydrogenase
MSTSAHLRSLPLSDEVRAFLAGPRTMLIGGQWCGAGSGGYLEVIDPSYGIEIARVARASKTDVDRAVEAARRCLESPGWRQMTPGERAELLLGWADLIKRDARFLAELDSLDVGLPLQKTLEGEITAVVEDLRYYAGWTTKLYGQSIPTWAKGYHVYTRREPVGVCGAITAWNYPMEAVSGKLGPALACGNTVVLKPAEQSSLSALWMAGLAEEAGFPPGALNVVTGLGQEAGAALAVHLGVDKVGFTGSTETGRKIVEASAGNLKRVSLELGGKSPQAVFADAAVDKAVSSIVDGIFLHSGQNCIAGSRLLVEQEVFEDVLDAIVARSRELQIGPAFEPSTQVGPLVSQSQRERVQGFIARALADGGRLRSGGGQPRGVPEGGFYLEPTVFTDVSDDSELCQQEVFGPVLVAASFKDFDEAVRRSNATPYGLAASVWTSDMSRAFSFADALEAGTVWVNGHNLYDAAAPFGGRKASGYGRELGEASLLEYTELKSVWVGHGGS